MPLQLVQLQGGAHRHTRLYLELQTLSPGTFGGTLLVPGWGYGSVEECFPSMPEDLDLILSTEAEQVLGKFSV